MNMDMRPMCCRVLDEEMSRAAVRGCETAAGHVLEVRGCSLREFGSRFHPDQLQPQGALTGALSPHITYPSREQKLSPEPCTLPRPSKVSKIMAQYL